MILQSSLTENAVAADNEPPLLLLQQTKETPVESSNQLPSTGTNEESKAVSDANQELKQEDQQNEAQSKDTNKSHRERLKVHQDNDEEEDEDDIYDEIEIISPNKNLSQVPIESAEPIQQQEKRVNQDEKKIWSGPQVNIQQKITPSLPQPNAVMQGVKRESEEANYQSRMTNAYKSRLLIDQRDPIKPEPNDSKIRQLNDPSMNQVTPLPLVQKGVYSLVSDMKLGWKPKNDKKASYLYEVPPVIAFRYKEDELYRQLQNMQQQQMAQPIQQQQNYA